MDAASAKKRLAVMLAVDAVCVLVALAAAIGVFRFGQDGLLWVFGAALILGFAAQVWFIAGFRRAKEGG